jgi:hypothetical protein
VSKKTQTNLIADRRVNRSDHHPLVIVSDKAQGSAQSRKKSCIMKCTLRWLAGKVGLPYLRRPVQN